MISLQKKLTEVTLSLGKQKYKDLKDTKFINLQMHESSHTSEKTESTQVEQEKRKWKMNPNEKPLLCIT